MSVAIKEKLHILRNVVSAQVLLSKGPQEERRFQKRSQDGMKTSGPRLKFHLVRLHPSQPSCRARPAGWLWQEAFPSPGWHSALPLPASPARPEPGAGRAPSRASRGAHSSASAAACPARTDTARPDPPRSRALRAPRRGEARRAGRPRGAATPRCRHPRGVAPAGQPRLLPSCALPSVSALALAWKMKFVRAPGRWRAGLFRATENRSPRDQGFSSSHGHPRGWLHITFGDHTGGKFVCF